MAEIYSKYELCVNKKILQLMMFWLVSTNVMSNQDGKEISFIVLNRRQKAITQETIISVPEVM